MKKNYLVYLKDMLESSLKGTSFIQDISFEEFLKDEKTQYALIRAIELVGEAGTKVPSDIRGKFSEIPWREVSGMRNKLIHEYFSINLKAVFKTGKEDLPALSGLLKKIIRDIEDAKFDF
jgi:uncharacterized protein with HEPN domain